MPFLFVLVPCCKLKFNKHVEDTWQKTWQKFNALARLPPLGLGLVLGLAEWQFFSGTIALKPEETTIKRILMNAFFKYQFNYCPLVWMCCNKSLNSKTNRLHKRHHRIVYNYKKSNFNELLVKDSSLSLCLSLPHSLSLSLSLSIYIYIYIFS